jgi:hypothetical protein
MSIQSRWSNVLRPLRWRITIRVLIIVYATFGLYLLLLLFQQADFGPERDPILWIIRILQKGNPLLLAVVAFVVGIFYYGLAPLLRENVYDITGASRRSSESASELSEIRKKLELLQRQNVDEKIAARLKETTDDLKKKIEDSVYRSTDLSTPDNVFVAARQRLIDESVRIDRISRRNLYFGIVFSAFALGFLAWPLIAQTLFQGSGQPSSEFDTFRWVAQAYLPRFAVGLLLQFVGFFFLRLYVANELDLKHNKNELTNLEMRMMGLQLARIFGDASSKKEIVKSFASTERNFVVKKGERVASNEALSEYNDLKSLIEKLISKIPAGSNK